MDWHKRSKIFRCSKNGRLIMEYKKFEGSVNVILGDYPRSAANPKAREILKSIGWDSTKYDQMRTFQSHHRRFKQSSVGNPSGLKI